MSILTRLHSEDARVVPLLGSVEALHALISRHSRRIALAKDPAYGAEMAVLILTNSQWQQQQQQQQQQVAQTRQIQEEQLRAKQQAQAVKPKAEADTNSSIIANAPWFYADPQGNVQGPFGGGEMRQWLEAGYFKGDLPISQNSGGPFRSLASLFPDLNVAFKSSDITEQEDLDVARPTEITKSGDAISPVQESLIDNTESCEASDNGTTTEASVDVSKARVENNDTMKSLKEDSEQYHKAQTSISNKNQSDQLKMLLGLGALSKQGMPVEIMEDNSTKPLDTDEVCPDNGQKHKDESNSQNKGSKVEHSNKVEEPISNKERVKMPVIAPVPAWGGAGTGKGAGRKKSMSEIQQEEAKAAALLAKQSMGRTSSGGWANIAASGGTGAWSGNAVISSESLSMTPITSTISPSVNGMTLSRAKHAPVSCGHKQVIASKQNSTTQKTMEEFGANGKMSPSLEAWCKEQMRKLNGSEDLTLVAFCMTLSDSIEIRQYLTAYLGTSAQVNNFASEFISRKNGGNSQQEQWETTANTKKGRRKKTGSAK